MEPISKLKPDFCKEIKDEKVGLTAFLVIDKRISGLATGGIRMTEDLTLEEVANLAHDMTLKYAFLNIKKDGAKAGIVAPAGLTKQKKAELCEAFGESIRDLVQKDEYSPGEDLGINSEDFAFVLKGAGIVSSKSNLAIKSEYYTALTVFLSAKALYTYRGRSLQGVSVIIEGFGKVGEQAAILFSQAGAKIIGVSTFLGALFDSGGLDVEKLCQLKKAHADNLIEFYRQDKRIECGSLLLQKTDILIPGARPDSINSENIDKVQVSVIIPIANIAATEAIEIELFNKGITYIPGFISNCGGILSFFLDDNGFNVKEIDSIIREGFTQKLNRLFKTANKAKKAISDVARQKVFKNIKKIDCENKTPKISRISTRRLTGFIYRKLIRMHLGWIIKPLAKHYIRERLFS